MRNTRSLLIPNVEIEIEHQKHSLYVNLSKLICLSRKPNYLRLAALLMNPRTGPPVRPSDTVAPLYSSGSPEWKKFSTTNLSPFRLLIFISLLVRTNLLHNRTRCIHNDQQGQTATSISSGKGPRTSIANILITSQISLTITISPHMPFALIGLPEPTPITNVHMLGWPK